MADTGWLSPGVAIEPDGYGDITNPGNIKISDNTYAVASNTYPYLFLRDFGANVPEGAKITGYEVRLEGYYDDAPNTIADMFVELYLGPDTNSYSTLGSFDNYLEVDMATEDHFSVGGSSDTANTQYWNRGLTSSQVNSENFALYLTIDSHSGTLYIDSIQLKIYYEEGDKRETLYVNGDGYYTSGWRAEGGDYQRIDETVQDGNTTRLYSPTAGDVASFTLTDLQSITSSDTIISVQLYAWVYSLDPVSSQFLTGLRIGSGDYPNFYEFDSYGDNSGYKLYGTRWDAHPGTGLPWTVSDINALEAYIKKDNSAGQAVTQMYLVVSANSTTTTSESLQKTLEYNVISPGSLAKSLIYDILVPPTDPESAGFGVNYFGSGYYGSKYAGTSITQASLNKSLKYSISVQETVSKQVQYSISNSKSFNKALEYQVLAPGAGLGKSLLYRISANVSVARSMGYEITKGYTQNKDLVYRVSTAGSLSKTLKYSILPDSRIGKTLDYSVITSGSLNKVVEYRLGASHSMSKSLRYILVPETMITIGLIYSIHASNSLTKEIEYRIGIGKTITKSLGYSIRTAGSISKNIQYKIIAPSTLSKDLSYVIHGQGSVEKALSYKVKSANGLTKEINYIVATQYSQDYQSIYRIKTIGTVSKELTYGVITDGSLSKALGYNIVRRGGLTKSISYIVRAKGTLQKILEYVLGRRVGRWLYKPQVTGTEYDTVSKSNTSFTGSLKPGASYQGIDRPTAPTFTTEDKEAGNWVPVSRPS